jgi:K+-sensing histidine kinase KdpD
MISDAAVMFLHDLKAPIRAIGLAASEVRKKTNVDRGELNKLLEAIEDRVAEFDKAAISGASLLKSDSFENLNRMDVVEPIREWAFNQKECHVDFKPPRNRRDFIIDHGHEWLVRTVLGNLYVNSRNAAARGDRDAKLWIECVVHDGRQASAHLEVLFNDNGPGVQLPPEEWHRLFHILKPKEQRGPGWGIGLPISKRMMQVMDGDLELIKSVPYELTTFRLLFKAGPE